jgi:hypothetical protein
VTGVNERMEAFDGQNASTDRNSAFLGFLKGVLANGPVSITELELQARAAMLLGERQPITHAKLFKRAKKVLSIRSVRIGFGAAGRWSWVLSQVDVAEPAGHHSANPPPGVINGADVEPEQASRLEPQLPSRIGVPREWIDGVASLDRHRAPPHVPRHRWVLFIDDCQRFLDPNAIWAAEAAALGWTTTALFGCAQAQPLAYLQVAGLLWVLCGRKLLRLHPDWASIADPADGSRHVLNVGPPVDHKSPYLGGCDDENRPERKLGKSMV